MQEYLILKDCTGSQTGHDFNQFTAGTTAKLSDDLAAAFLKEGWAKPVEKAAADIAKAPAELAHAVLETIVEARETKVMGPEETKPAELKAKKGKK